MWMASMGRLLESPHLKAPTLSGTCYHDPPGVVMSPGLRVELERRQLSLIVYKKTHFFHSWKEVIVWEGPCGCHVFRYMS